MKKQKIESLKIQDRYYHDEVPDTLDLAERAKLAINALTQIVDPKNNYESYQCAHLDHNPPYMNHTWGGPCLQKAVEVIPMMRVMSGSTFNNHVDKKMVDGLIRDIEEDGLWWLKTAGRPWRVDTFKEDQVWPVAHARLMIALMVWYEYDREPGWLKIVEHMADGLAKIAIHKDDRAYYHISFSRSGWRVTMNDPCLQKLDEPPTTEFYNIGLPLRALARWYAVSGDKKALDLAEQLVRFMLKPAMWGSSEGPTMVIGAEHGHWEGHFHMHTMGVMGLLEYAIATNDTRLKRIVADFYEYARSFGIARIGFFSAVIGPLDKVKALNILDPGSGEGRPQVDESCAVADMIWIAVNLSNAGVGDYWEDVDQYVRNHLVEHQLLRRDLLEEISAAGPVHKIDPRWMTNERVIERNIGAFASGGDPTLLYAWWTMCCVGNSCVALYKVWESIIRCTDSVVQVNLLLNRASPWLDIDSYLPYEGKVVLKNKTAEKVYVRIPVWVDKKSVQCEVNKKKIPLHWLNNYLIIEGLVEKDTVTIKFPMVESIEKYTEPTYSQQYTCRFKGNTLIDISPRAESPAWAEMTSDDGERFKVNKGYPIYQREFYKKEKSPMKEVMQYVSPIMIR